MGADVRRWAPNRSVLVCSAHCSTRLPYVPVPLVSRLWLDAFHHHEPDVQDELVWIFRSHCLLGLAVYPPQFSTTTTSHRMTSPPLRCYLCVPSPTTAAYSRGRGACTRLRLRLQCTRIGSPRSRTWR